MSSRELHAANGSQRVVLLDADYRREDFLVPAQAAANVAGWYPYACYDAKLAASDLANPMTRALIAHLGGYALEEEAETAKDVALLLEASESLRIPRMIIADERRLAGLTAATPHDVFIPSQNLDDAIARTVGWLGRLTQLHGRQA